MNGATASSEMRSFLKALQVTISDKPGNPVLTMKTEMTDNKVKRYVLTNLMSYVT